MTDILVPNIELRPYQIPVWKALEAGADRAAMVWPRRGGKDTVSLQWTKRSALTRVGNYWHMLPEKDQARKAIWNAINRDGQRVIDLAFPPELRRRLVDQEMFIELVNGSTWQVGGSDRYDALVGSNPVGVVFSEYAIGNPRAYEFVRPILLENKGWALFPYTPRGRNHGHKLFEMLKRDPNSFAELLTCDDTGHMSAEGLERERSEMSDELFQQEYYGSWDFGIEGAFYAKLMNDAVKAGRVCAVPYDQSRPVYAGGDIGLSDDTAIWFWQLGLGGQPQWIDYLEANGQQVKYYVDQIKAKGYTLGAPMFLPHDAGHRRIGMPRTVAEQFRDLGIDTMVLPLESNIQPGIEACRVMIGRSVFDDDRTEAGRSALMAYRREYDDKRQAFRQQPRHDWASNGADGLRYAVQAINLGHCVQNRWGPDPDYSTLNKAVI